MELLEALKEIDLGNVIAPIDGGVQDALNLVLSQKGNLEESLASAVNNVYGFFDGKDILGILERLERLENKRLALIDAVGKALLGENYRDVLNSLGAQFQITLDGPPCVIFFRPGAVK